MAVSDLINLTCRGVSDKKESNMPGWLEYPASGRVLSAVEYSIYHHVRTLRTSGLVSAAVHDTDSRRVTRFLRNFYP